MSLLRAFAISFAAANLVLKIINASRRFTKPNSGHFVCRMILTGKNCVLFLGNLLPYYIEHLTECVL